MTVVPVILLSDKYDDNGLLMPISGGFLPGLIAGGNDIDIILNTCQKSTGFVCPEQVTISGGVLTRQRLSFFANMLAVFKNLANEANTTKKPNITLQELLIYIRDNEQNLSLSNLQMIPAYDSPIPNKGIDVDGDNNPFLSDSASLETPEIAPFIGKTELSVGDIWDNGEGSANRFYLVTCVHLGYGISIFHWESQNGEKILVQDVFESVEERLNHDLCDNFVPPLPVGYGRAGGKYLTSCAPEKCSGAVSFNVSQRSPGLLFRKRVLVSCNCDEAVGAPYKWRRLGGRKVECWNWLAAEPNQYTKVETEWEEKHEDSDFWYNVPIASANTVVTVYGLPVVGMFAGVNEPLPAGVSPVVLGGFGFMPVLFGGVAVGFIGSAVSSLVANIRTNFKRD